MTTSVHAPREDWARQLASAMCGAPVVRWLITHHSVSHDEPRRTQCNTCAHSLWPRSCGPSGRCRICYQPNGPAPLRVEAVLVAAIALLVLTGTRGWELAAFTWWTAGMTTLAFIDVAVLRLPFTITLVTSAGTALLLLPTSAPCATWSAATLGTLALVAFYTVVHLISPGGLGLGDVLLALPIGLAASWHDWRHIPAVIVLAHALAIATLIQRRVTGGTQTYLPLGPYLASTTYVVLILGRIG